jgi:hypothetical protein
MNDAQLSQTTGRAKTPQPGHLMKPTQIVQRSYDRKKLKQKMSFLTGNTIQVIVELLL